MIQAERPLALPQIVSIGQTGSMSDPIEPPVNPATPWEFLVDDDQVWEPEPAAEEAAMHVMAPEGEGTDPPLEDLFLQTDDVAHYLEDERPEIVDANAPVTPSDTTSPVGKLLERQHYLSPGHQDHADGPDDMV